MKMNSLFRKKEIPEEVYDTSEGLHEPRLIRNLKVKDLTFMGIAAIIGAGIFSTIGNAAYHGGPAVSLLFVFTAIACAFSALCYAEFASRIPLSGSAYTYAYVSFGEIIAWIIGWTLIVEYAIGNIAVAISWSDYFTGLIKGLTGFNIPPWLTMDYLSAFRGYESVKELLLSGNQFQQIPPYLQEAYLSWTGAPEILGLKLVFDLPALLIVIAITGLVYRGIHESKRVSNLLVYLKLGVILLVIIAGAFYVDPENWSPFAPNGIRGVLQGVSSVFFAFIGFDALSSTAEECTNPKKDLPRSMMFSLLICTGLYIIITLVLTGMISYKELALGDPLSYVFERKGLSWISGIVSVSAVIAIASVLLVFQLGQPRIWMSMGRDGLLPKRFARLHPKYKTPAFSTIVTGVFVAVPALFMNLKEVTDLSSIGTLFAFVVVCAGVLKMERNKSAHDGSFRVPYINARYFLPMILASVLFCLYLFQRPALIELLNVKNLQSGFFDRIPRLSFLVLSVFMMIQSYRKNLSLIPVLGLLCNFYLMTELNVSNWTFFFIWLLLGLVVYFMYGIKNSKQAKLRI